MHFTSSVPLLFVRQLTDNFRTHILGRYAGTALRGSVSLPQNLHCGTNTLPDNLKATCRYWNISMLFREQSKCQNLIKIASITMAVWTTPLLHVIRTIKMNKFAIFLCWCRCANVFFLPSVQTVVSLDQEFHGYSFDDTEPEITHSEKARQSGCSRGSYSDQRPIGSCPQRDCQCTLQQQYSVDFLTFALLFQVEHQTDLQEIWLRIDLVWIQAPAQCHSLLWL